MRQEEAGHQGIKKKTLRIFFLILFIFNFDPGYGTRILWHQESQVWRWVVAAAAAVAVV